MFRIRFHGRGGQGIKTASRILGTAFFLEGWQVQDAPRYGAERRGAPIFAYVRADKKLIFERGIITAPDLVVVVDDTLVGIPAAGVLQGLGQNSILLIHGSQTSQEWRSRIKTDAEIIVLTAPAITDQEEQPYAGAACVGAVARLTGVLSFEKLKAAFKEELQDKPPEVIEENIDRALEAYEAMAVFEGRVKEHDERAAVPVPPEWIEMPLDPGDVAAPAIHAGATSVEVPTGLWRTMRPVLEREACNKCTWVCGSFCPDGVISVDAKGYPEVDYDHCKGCLICVVQCPKHAFLAVPEREAASAEEGGSS